MSSPKTPPNCQKPSIPFSFFRNFSRKQKKIVKVCVLGGRGVGKSAFVVRFLTRRFIGDYSSDICHAYPHTLALDNMPTSIIVWDSPAISTQNVHGMCEQLDNAVMWSDVILLLYSITDRASYNTANIAHKYINNRLHHRKETSAVTPCVILVGNKNDLWQERQVATDHACQEAEAGGYTNFHEITTKGSLDQVRIVFTEGIRRGLATGEHRRQRTRRRTLSLDNKDEASPDSDDVSPKQSTINIMNNIRRKLMIHHKQSTTDGGSSDDARHVTALRTRSKTFSEGRCGLEKQVNIEAKWSGEEIQSRINCSRQRKMSVFEPRSASS